MTAKGQAPDLKEMIAKQMFHPDATLRPLDAAIKEVCNAQKVNALLKPAPSRPAPEAVIFFHGNRGNVTWYQDRLRQLSAKFPQAYVWTFDYAGFGKTPGSPATASILETAISFLKGIEKYYTGARRVVWVGESIGAATIAGILANVQPGQLAVLPHKVVLINTFTSISDASLIRPEGKTFHALIKVSAFEMPTVDWLKAIPKRHEGRAFEFEACLAVDHKEIPEEHMVTVAQTLSVPLNRIPGGTENYVWN